MKRPPLFSLAFLLLAALAVVVSIVLCFRWLFLLKVNSEDKIFLRGSGCKTKPIYSEFLTSLGFGSAWLLFGWFSSIVLALCGSLCVVVHLGIGHFLHRV